MGRLALDQHHGVQGVQGQSDPLEPFLAFRGLERLEPEAVMLVALLHPGLRGPAQTAIPVDQGDELVRVLPHIRGEPLSMEKSVGARGFRCKSTLEAKAKTGQHLGEMDKPPYMPCSASSQPDRRASDTVPFKGLWALFAVAIVLLATLSGGVSQPDQGDLPGGALVLPTHGDVAMPYESIIDVTVCYVDMDGSEHYNGEDSVVLVPRNDCSGTSQNNDVRLADWADRSAGTRLGSGADRGVTLSSLNPEPRFYYHNQDSNNRLTPGDTVYLSMHNADQAQIRTADVRITSNADHPVGSRVLATDSDHGRSVISLGTAQEALRHVDVLDTDSFTNRDFLYLTADTDREVAGQGDVRIFSPDADLAFGAFIGAGDPEPQDTIRNVNRYVCTVDGSETGIYDPGDPLFLSLGTQCTGTVQPQDIRITNTTHGAAGSRVQHDDADAGASYGVLPEARVAYIDGNGDNRISRGDIVVLRTTAAAENALEAGDVLLSPTNRGAGETLLEGDSLIGTATRDLGRFDNILFFKPSSGTTAIGDHDPFYISPEGATGRTLDPLDIRLVLAGELSFGGPAGLETGEINTPLTRDTTTACSTTSIPSDYTAGDPVYLRLDGSCPARVQEGLLRLVPVDEHSTLSIVRSGDSDMGRTLVTAHSTPQLRYFTVGESSWGYSTRLYLNIVDPGENRIQVGDIRLTAAGDDLPPGQAVLGSNSDRQVTDLTTLGPLADYAGYIDMDRSNNFGAGDHAYIAPTQTHDHVTPLTVRLTGLPDPFEPLTVAEPADPTTTDPDADGESPDPGETGTNGTDTSPDDPDEEDTPGPGIVLLLLAFGSVVVWRRTRKR